MEANDALRELIKINNVEMHFQSVKGNSVHALNSINLNVNEGEFMTLLGPSGCGKSTLMNIVGGLIRPTQGEVSINGQKVREPQPDVVSFVFQEPTLLPWKTVIKNVEFALEVRGTPKNQRYDIAREFLELVGINQFGHHYPHELSGGMRQRVALARALSLGTKIILMDEPFGALDEQSRIILGNELARIQSKTNKTVLFVTHSIEEAVYLSDRIAIMTRRPGALSQIIEVKFEKPRNPSLRSSYEFSKLKADIWKTLETQVEHAGSI